MTHQLQRNGSEHDGRGKNHHEVGPGRGGGGLESYVKSIQMIFFPLKQQSQVNSKVKCKLVEFEWWQSVTGQVCVVPASAQTSTRLGGDQDLVRQALLRPQRTLTPRQQA